ncbi:hypothetical protein GOB91_29165 [Sinorhizobium meliloti]|nr:hypothetical protein [Sinorhizobium meliloti]MDW9732625.1 hypothetical protein [Sinorhizobium meliloti]
MTSEELDEDMKEAVNELGNALSDALLWAEKKEVQRLIEAIDALVQVRIAQFAELAADRFEVVTRKIP